MPLIFADKGFSSKRRFNFKRRFKGLQPLEGLAR